MSQTKILRIDLDEFGKLSKSFRCGNVFVSSEYLKSLEKIKNIESYAIYEKDRLIAGFPVNIIRKGILKIFLNPPFTPYFNIVFESIPSKERERFRFFEASVKSYAGFLKSRFMYYSVSQSPELSDSRHFVWSRAKVSLRYTYYMESSKDALDGVDRMIKNKDIAEASEEYDFEKHYSMLAESYSKRVPISKSDYEILMNDLKKHGLIRCFSSKSASVTFLTDRANRTSYVYNICGEDTALLIYSVMKRNLLEGYAVDFLGANTKRISRYKSMFNPQIKSYFNISGIYDIIH